MPLNSHTTMRSQLDAECETKPKQRSPSFLRHKVGHVCKCDRKPTGSLFDVSFGCSELSVWYSSEVLKVLQRLKYACSIAAIRKEPGCPSARNFHPIGYAPSSDERAWTLADGIEPPTHVVKIIVLHYYVEVSESCPAKHVAKCAEGSSVPLSSTLLRWRLLSHQTMVFFSLRKF